MQTINRQRGFTLIEMVMVIVILGAIGGMVAVFMRGPIDAYIASARRAALTDVADTTVRRMGRDIRKALPNSIRTPNNQCLEFMPTKTGGRYRADDTAAGLNFSAADASFNMLGSNSTLAGQPLSADQRIAVGDVIVVYNLGITGSDAYSQDNTSVVVAPAPSEAGVPPETTITINSKQFPLASGSNRFHVLPANEIAVAYVCSGGDLHRTASTSFPITSCLATGPVLARNASCNFDYTGSDLQRNALVRMVLQMTESSETVTLQHEVHVNNTP